MGGFLGRPLLISKRKTSGAAHGGFEAERPKDEELANLQELPSLTLRLQSGTRGNRVLRWFPIAHSEGGAGGGLAS